jgi:hypothetical protein
MLLFVILFFFLFVIQHFLVKISRQIVVYNMMVSSKRLRLLNTHIFILLFIFSCIQNVSAHNFYIVYTYFLTFVRTFFNDTYNFYRCSYYGLLVVTTLFNQHYFDPLSHILLIKFEQYVVTTHLTYFSYLLASYHTYVTNVSFYTHICLHFFDYW